MKWLESWLPIGRSRRELPLLLRLSAEGAQEGAVDLQVTWYPSNVTMRRRAHVAQGLCLIPWQQDQASVTVAIRSIAHEGTISITSEANHRGQTHTVELVPCAGPPSEPLQSYADRARGSVPATAPKPS